MDPLQVSPFAPSSAPAAGLMPIFTSLAIIPSNNPPQKKSVFIHTMAAIVLIREPTPLPQIATKL